MLFKIIAVIVATVLIYGYQPLHAFWIPFAVIALAVVFVIEGVRVVPQQSAWVVERLGKFKETLQPGLNIIIPFFDRVAYRHSLKEVPADVPEQVCITKDNTQLAVDGLIYYQVTDPRLASYGTSDYVTAIVQLARATLRSRSADGADQSLQSRDVINRQIVNVLDEAGRHTGVKVLRYEVKNLTTRDDPTGDAGANHRRARKARADHKSEGESGRRSTSPGEKQATILTSKGKQSAINKARGGGGAARRSRRDRSGGERRRPGDGQGRRYGRQPQGGRAPISALGNLAGHQQHHDRTGNLSDVASVVASAMTVLDRTRAGAKPA
jgi:regulator of protease activity HflC (stomatin/prohibitin superfamily)